jgi:hypothetical protein
MISASFWNPLDPSLLLHVLELVLSTLHMPYLFLTSVAATVKYLRKCEKSFKMLRRSTLIRLEINTYLNI